MADPKPLLKAAFNAVTAEQCNQWITDCGYPE